jgi:hypothetical protein
VEVQHRSFLTSALYEDKRSGSRPGRFTPGEIVPVTIDLEAGWAPKPLWTLFENPTTIFRTPESPCLLYRNSSTRTSMYHDGGLQETFPIKFSPNLFSSSYYLYAIPVTNL